MLKNTIIGFVVCVMLFISGCDIGFGKFRVGAEFEDGHLGIKDVITNKASVVNSCPNNYKRPARD